MRPRMVLALVVGAASALGFTPSANAAPAKGSARVTAPDGSALTSGAKHTAFSLALPDGAACPGDSANDNYRVQSYVVPAAVDPASLTFGSAGPLPPGTNADLRQPLYQTTSSGYVNAQTANADFPGDSGAIVNVPAFSFAVFEASHIPPGAYNLGIACTKGPASETQLVRYWNTTIAVSAGIGWTAEAASQHAPTATEPSASESAASTAAAVSTHADDAATASSPAAVHSSGVVAAGPTGAEPNISVPALSIPSYVRSPGSSVLIAAVWALLLIALGRAAWMVVRGRPDLDPHRLSLLEEE